MNRSLTKPAVRNGLFIVLAVGAIYLVCGPFLSNPIVFDDYSFFYQGYPEKFFAAGPSFSTRWWVYETFAFTVLQCGQELRWLRLGNLLAHVAAAAALYFLVRQLLSDLDRKISAKVDADAAALLAATLFLLHPLAVFAQGYLIQRTILMATVFLLLSLLAFWRGLNGLRGGLALSCLFCFVAIYAKEHAVMLPAVSGVLWGLHRRSGLRQGVSDGAVLAALLVQGLVALLAVFQAKGWIGGAMEPLTTEILVGEAPVTTSALYPLSVLNQAALFFKYLLHWVLPNPSAISIDMREAFPLDFSSVALWMAAIAYLAYGVSSAVLLLKGGASGLLGAALLVPWILFFTEFSTARVQEPFVLYRSYLWMPLLFAGFALAARRLSTFLTIALGVLAALALAALSFDRLTTLSHPYLVWNETVELLERDGVRPGVFGAYRLYYNRGKAAYQEGMQDKALADFDRAIQIKPDFGHAYHQRGTIWLSRKEWLRAAIDFERAMVLVPNHVKSYRGRAKALEEMGNADEARKTREFACLLDSAFADCRK